ncbi:hypothetical protein BGZ74_009475 [Mortierella antarctica]|nr:hypothetical protein BGZ74_009475 [Mortierella antarctica]
MANQKKKNHCIVKSIIGHDRVEGLLMYVVIWKKDDSPGLVAEADTACPQLIRDYWDRLEQQGGSRQDETGALIEP